MTILEDDLSSDKGVDYQKLRDLLKEGNWREADRETLAVMIKVAGEDLSWLDIESINNFPCIDLRTTDQLWVKYSNGRFGFSVQKRIWETFTDKSGEWDYTIYQKFGDRVGWYVRQKEYWKNYEDLTFSQNAPFGHLPARFLMRVLVIESAGCAELFSRIETCKI